MTTDFQPLYKPFDKPVFRKPNIHNFMRSQFRIETIALWGALFQSILAFILPARLAILPCAAFLLFKVLDAYAIKTGLKPNPHMDANVDIKTKFSAQFPDARGNFGNTPARSSMAVFIIGSRNNTALGLLDPRFNKLGKYFNTMCDELAAHPSKHGYLGGSAWLGTERATNASNMMIMYFRCAADVHAYAHGPLHKEAWNWWYSNLKDLSELSIYHELYEVPSGNYEAVYAQMPPMLAAATQHRVTIKTDRGEEEKWMLPVVDARKGSLATSKGRMARSDGRDNDKYEIKNLYEDVEHAPREVV